MSRLTIACAVLALGCFARFASAQTCVPKADLGAVAGMNVTKVDNFDQHTGSCFFGNRFYNVYSFSGTAGQTVTFQVQSITLNGTPTLAIANDLSSTNVAFNFGNPGPWTVTLPTSRSYVILVGTLEQFVTGQYSFRAVQGSVIPAPTPTSTLTPTITRSPTQTPTPTPTPTITPTRAPVTPTLVPRMPIILAQPGPTGPRF